MARNTSIDTADVKPKLRAKLAGYALFMREPDMSLQQVWRYGKLDPDDPESPQIHEVVGIAAFRRWARDGDWAGNRRKLWIGIEDRVRTQLQTELMQSEAERLAKLAQVTDRLMLHILGGKDDDGNDVKPVSPKSLEGAATALVSLEKFAAMRRDVVRDVLAQAAASGEGGEPDLNAGTLPREDRMSEDEINEMTRRIVLKRAGVEGYDDDDRE